MRKSVAKIISVNRDCEAVCASAAKMSTQPGNAWEIFEKSRVSETNTSLIGKVLASGHKSVIEHAVFSIAFWDVSVFVEQFFIECRLASFTVKSRRYVDFRNLGYLIPEELEGASRDLYTRHMETLFDGYRQLLDLDVPKEDARFLLPYCFCSNFYCTLNARELATAISAIRFGRGRNIPELQSIADQLTEQLKEIYPALLSELEHGAEAPTDECRWSDAPVSFVSTADAGAVKLVSAPVEPMALLETAHAIAHPGSKLDLDALITDPRPRELEQLSYGFVISDLTLSGLTHLVRHRMQSIAVPSLLTADHSRVILPDSVRDNAQAKAIYEQTLEAARAIRLEAAKDEALRPYGYYFALSGNVVTVMSTMNAREMRLFVRLRSCTRAQWEIRKVAIDALRLVRKSFPELFGKMGPSCFVNGVCPEGKMTCGRKAEMLEKFGGEL